jgi:acyl dehydratase
MKLLHGEQYLELYQILPTSGGTFRSKAHIVDILDKGKGVLVVVGVTTVDKHGTKICYNEFSNFIRGGGKKGATVVVDDESSKDAHRSRRLTTATLELPKRKPDKTIREKTNEHQAATLYRLNGDYNPLHIDPAMAALGGFEKPILHGLCTFGYAAKHIFESYCRNDSYSFKAIKARFTKHVFPGETLQTEMWKENDRIYFQMRVLERNEIVISNAAVELRASSSSPSATIAADEKGSSLFQCSVFFDELRLVMQTKSTIERQNQVQKVKAIFQFDVTNTQGHKQTWYIDLKNHLGDIGVGKPSSSADLTVTIQDSVLMDLIQGKLHLQKAFLAGKLVAKGKLTLAALLEALLKDMRSSRL